MSNPKVTVVIPTLNSGKTFERCLSSIRANSGRYDYEIIVVDGGSTDTTLEIARKYNATVLNGLPKRVNRNIGVKQANGDVICFTDSDCLVPQDWLDKLVDGLLRLNGENRRIAGVGGGNVPWLDNPSSMELAISRTMRSPLVSFGARNVTIYRSEREVQHNPPMSSAYFRKVLEEVGGFSEEYGYGGEDLELDAKITEKGYKLYYIPGATVWHRHRSDFKKFAWQMYHLGKGKIRVGRKFPKYLPLHHYGPACLCLMSFSPLIFIPLGMGLLNGVYVSFRERSHKLFFPLVFLTMGFYVCYGAGEIAELVRGKRP